MLRPADPDPNPPPLAPFAAERRPAPLPAPTSPLIGREREVAELGGLLRPGGARLLTLTGPAGVGKSRLALELAGRAAAGFEDGAVWVPLAAVADPRLVLPAVARALGVGDTGAEPTPERLARALGDRRLLAVVDNVEQVAAAAPRLADLLTGCPGLTVLATSRVPLRVRGEREVPVAPLRVAASGEDGGDGPTPDSRPRTPSVAPAVELFVARAREVRPDFALTAENAATVAGICARLDGLPLAIELAAARAKVLPPAALLARLERRLALLTGGARDLPVRQQTMRAAIAWSYDLLPEEARALFRRLAVFAGGFGLEAAEAVSRGVEESRSQDGAVGSLDSSTSRLLDSVGALVDHSLLRRADGPGDEPRFAMLETVREHGLDLLAADPDAEAARAAHAAWFLGLAERAEATFLSGEEADWLPGLEAEADNLRAALGWLAERGDAGALRLAGALVWFWFVSGRFAEGRVWLDRVLGMPRAGGADGDRVKALHAAGFLAHYHGDDGRAMVRLEEGERLGRRAGDRTQLARVLLTVGVVAEDAGEFGRAGPYLAEALALFRGLDAPLWVANTLFHQAVVAFGRGDLGGAATLGEAALGAYRTLGGRLGVAVGTSATLDLLALVAAAGGDGEAAAAAHREALDMRWGLRDRWGVAGSLSGIAALAAGRGQGEAAARLAGAAEALRDELGVPTAQPERAVYAAGVAAARALLGEAAFGAAWAAGRALPPEAAVGEADALLAAGSAPDVTGGVGSAAAEPVEPAVAAGLTVREREVLGLVARGLTDRQVGEALHISHRTAMRHAANIYLKLGVNSRTAAAAFALRHGLA